MSLINKMLKDLEARQHPSLGRATPQPVYEDLRPAAGAPPRGRAALVVAICAGALVVAGIIAWAELHRGIFHATRISQVVAPGYVPQAAPAGKPATVSAPVPSAATVSGTKQTPSRRAQGAPSHPSMARHLAPKSGSQHPDAHVQPVRRARIASADAAVVAAAPQVVAQAQPDSAVDSSQIARTEIPLTPEQTAENSYRLGAHLLEQNHRSQAEQTLKSAIATNPKHVKARELLAGLLLEDGRWAEAEQLLQQGLSVLPRQSAFIYLLARVDVEHGGEPQAISLLEKGLPDARADAQYLALLATLYERVGRNADAARMFSQALTLSPLEGKWWLGLGISLEAQRDFADARDAYNRAKLANLDPELAKYADERLKAIRFK
ncbi:MAG: tetratricopeptide repeat protein [Acidiferrobacterales bacterium]